MEMRVMRDEVTAVSGARHWRACAIVLIALLLGACSGPGVLNPRPEDPGAHSPEDRGTGGFGAGGGDQGGAIVVEPPSGAAGSSSGDPKESIGLDGGVAAADGGADAAVLDAGAADALSRH